MATDLDVRCDGLFAGATQREYHEACAAMLGQFAAAGQPRTLELHQRIRGLHAVTPIGCTREYAFALVQARARGPWQLRALCLGLPLHEYDTPHRADRANRSIVDPWRTWPQEIRGAVLASACFMSYVYLVLQRQILVLDAANDWARVYDVRSDSYAKVYACDANPILLACLGENSITKCYVLHVYCFSTEQWAEADLGAIRPSTLEVGKEMSGCAGTTLMVGVGDTTRQYSYDIARNSISVRNTLRLWPCDDQTHQSVVSDSATVIRHRTDRVFQAYRSRYVYYRQAQPEGPVYAELPHTIVDVEMVGADLLVVHDTTNGLHICSASRGTLRTITNQVVAGFATYVSPRMQPSANAYRSVRVSSTRISLLLPNGTLVMLQPQQRVDCAMTTVAAE